ncbi:MAG: type III pantothenate kinase [Desulfatibacillaceae bacterium]
MHLLVVDIGNTNTVIGVYDRERLLRSFRIRTEREATEDEFHVLVSSLFQAAGMDLDKVGATIVSCVVPPMRDLVQVFCEKYMGHAPVWVSAHTDAGMPILYSNPAEVGADRIVNGVAAYAKYGCALIVIDFGTATTFDCISTAGEYLGGAISPGIGIAAEALYARASKLPRVELSTPPRTSIGKTTAESMQAGIIMGYGALVDGMVARIRREMADHVRVIATGGLARLMERMCDSIEAVEPDLTLEGLRIIHERVSKGAG